MRFRLSQSAKLDLIEIVSYIGRDNPTAAKRMTQRLRARIRTAARMPRVGRHIPEWPAEDIREVIVGNYRTQYRILDQEIVVLAIIEGHRLVEPQR